MTSRISLTLLTTAAGLALSSALFAHHSTAAEFDNQKPITFTGTVPGALIGALIVAVINSGLIFFSINSNWTNFVTGAVIVIAVGSDALIRRRRASRALRGAV